jgi:hypothetical protein
LACERKIERVDVVGADMSGPLDFTGDRADGRAKERWQGERQRFNQVRAWANKLGIRLVRWIPEDEGLVTTTNAALVVLGE